MLFEYAEMLSIPYRLKNLNYGYPIRGNSDLHVSSIWVCKNRIHWLGLKELTKYLNDEYRYRFDKKKNHESYEVIKNLECPNFLPEIEFEEPPLVVDTGCSFCDNKIDCYRVYYKIRKGYPGMSEWTKRGEPDWWSAIFDNIKQHNSLNINYNYKDYLIWLYNMYNQVWIASEEFNIPPRDRQMMWRLRYTLKKDYPNSYDKDEKIINLINLTYIIENNTPKIPNPEFGIPKFHVEKTTQLETLKTWRNEYAFCKSCK